MGVVGGASRSSRKRGFAVNFGASWSTWKRSWTPFLCGAGQRDGDTDHFNGDTGQCNDYTDHFNGYTSPCNGYTDHFNGYASPCNGYTDQRNDKNGQRNDYAGPQNAQGTPPPALVIR